jgi:type II secretory pathway predicted ATPase ExeA/TPR repeat protein
MGKPEPISVIRSVAEPVAAAVAATSPRPFAGESAGSGYFESDHHHRYIATAIFRELTKGHGLVLLCGEHTADVDLVERFLNEEGRERYRASLVRCRPEMDFGALVRAYNRRLGLRQEAGSDGIWALLSHLMAEVRKGVRRLLVLENAESLDLTCFDELLRFMRLDEPHVMPVVLLGSADFAERLATPAFGFLNSAITGRVPFDRIEQEEVGAFLHYQLNVCPGDERALFPPEIVNLIAVRAGGSAAVINRLALDVLEQGRRDAALAAPPEPAPTITIVPPAQEAAPEPAEILEASVEPEESEQAEPLEVKAPEAETLEAEAAETDAAEAAPSEAEPAELESAKAEPLEAEPPPRLVAGGRTAISAPTGTTEKRRARLSVRTGLALYVVAAVLAGLGLLYFLAPRGHEPSATVASTAGSAQTPIAAAPDKSSAAATTAKEAPSDAAAAQAAAVEPAAGPSATPPASAPQAAPEQNGPVVIGAKIVPLTAPAPAASAPATPATPAPTASASAEPSPATSSEPTASASSAPAATATSESATPAQPPVASAAPQPAPNPPAAPAPSRAADAAPASSPAPVPASEAAAQPASPAPSEAAAAASSEAAAPAVPKAGASTASAPVPAASQPASAASAAQASAPASSGATQALAPLAALEPARVPSQEQPPQPPKVAHPNAELTLLVQRGDELLAAGDIYSARQFYERAAQAGDPAAQCGLGKSYDPVYLRQLGARGVAGDAATAAGWYRRAAAAGNNEAAARLARLDAANPNGSNSK